MAEALTTVGDFVRESRVLLQDTVVPYRYTDTELVSTFNMGMLETRRLRADLFLPLFEVPYFDTSGAPDLTAKVTIEPMYRPALVYYLVGMTQLRDDEATTDQRAAAFQARFIAQMLSIQA